MLRKFVLMCMLAFITFSVRIDHAYAYPGGLVNGKTVQIGYTLYEPTNENFWSKLTHTTSTSYLTDNNLDTDFEFQTRKNARYIYYIFPDVVNVDSFYVYVTSKSSKSSIIYAVFDENNNLLKNGISNLPESGQKFIDVKVNRIKSIVVGFSTWSQENYFTLAEFDVFESPPLPPSVPSGLKAETGVESVSLTWNKNPDHEKVIGYNVYQNGVKVNDSPIAGTSYVVQGLIPDQYYAFQVSALNVYGESGKSQVVNGLAMSQPKYPDLTYSSLQSDRLRLNWTDTGANKYLIYQDGVKIAESIYTFHDVTGLNPNQSYTFRVDAIDRYGRQLPSNSVTVTTKSAEPTKPLIKVSNVTQNGFTVTWIAENAESYDLYLNGHFVTNITNTSYHFSGLQPETKYSIRVVSKFYDLEAVSEVSVMTAKLPVPEIISAKVSGTGVNRELTFKTNELVTAVRVYVDGVLIGEYPVDQNVIDLTFDDLTKLTADLRIEPVDQGGVPYSFTVPVSGSGNDQVDDFLGSFLPAGNVLKKAFLYLAIASLSLFIIVLIFFYFRKQFKRMVNDKRDNLPFESVKDTDFKKIGKLSNKYSLDIIRNEREVYKKPYKDFQRSRRQDYLERNDFKIAERRFNTIKYRKQHKKRTSQIMVPINMKNHMKLVSNQVNAIKSAFTGSNKKIF